MNEKQPIWGASRKTPVVLVVDDDDRSLHLIEALLLPLGVQVVLARSGEDALTLVRTTPPDVILLDVIMPGLDGFDTARRLKADPASAFIPVVIITARGRDVADRIKALDAGADDFLAKPVDRAELQARVRTLIQVKDYNDHLREDRAELEQQVARRTAELQREIAQRRQLELAIMDAEAGERRRISLDLHDGLGQILTALAMMARDLALDLHEAGSTGVSKAELITELIEQAKQNLRDLTTGSALIHRDVEDLAESIRELADQTQSLFNLSCTVDFDLQGCELGGGRYAQLSRIASEAVHNAVKHAKADRLSISLRREGELVVLRVGDNGVGMQQPMAASGMGLKIMKHRADLIGAQLNVESRAGNGTTVICLMEAHCHAG